MSDIFKHRRIIAADSDELRRLWEFPATINSTPWKSHAPQTVKCDGINGKQLDDGSIEVIADFHFETPKEFILWDQRTGEFHVLPGGFKLADFNEFDFGELWEPQATGAE